MILGFPSVQILESYKNHNAEDNVYWPSIMKSPVTAARLLRDCLTPMKIEVQLENQTVSRPEVVGLVQRHRALRHG
jgi:hypothetical protein